MQKTVRTLDGKTLYVNVEAPYWIQRTTKYPFPNWQVIYDLEKPMDQVEGIEVQQKQETVLLHLAIGIVLAISTEDFLELLFPDWHIGSNYQFSKREVGAIYAELLTTLWDEREDSEQDEQEEKYLDTISHLEQKATGDDW